MRLSTTYIFYADAYFVQNFLMKTTVIFLALWVNKERFGIPIYKIILSSGIGTILEVTFLMWSHLPWLAGIYSVLEIPVIVCVLLGKRWKQIVKISISGFFFVMIMNGFIEILWNYFGKWGHYGFLVCLSCGIGVFTIKHLLRYCKIQKGIYPVELLHKGQKVSCYGFYDTGNCLKDVYTGNGVHIISKMLGERLHLSEEKAVLIPYASLGREADLIKVYYLEHICVYDKNKQKKETPVAVGLAEDNLFQNKKYDMILNENIW